MASLFDPLDALSKQADEVVIGARKREIGNILKSYVGFFDPFAELIQNSMDAVDERERSKQEVDYKKRIWLEINLKDNTFSITDNGIGFDKDKFQRFLAPSITFKPGRGTRGKKGVGATYLAYGFNFLQLGTKIPGYELVGEFTNGRKWVEDQENIVSRPTVSESIPLHSAFQIIDRGATFTLRFVGDMIRPRDLGWIGATTATQWKVLFLLRTPLGHITLDNEKRGPVLFNIKVIDRDGNETELINQNAGYIFPHAVISASVDLRDMLNELQTRIDKTLDPSKLPDKFKRLNGIYQYMTNDEISQILTARSSQHVELAKKYNATAYGYFCYSVRVWDQYNDEIVKLRKGLRVLRGGLQIAANYMPQGELIAIPLTSNIGYQNQVHVVVHFNEAEPDLGRKGFQPEIREVAEEISTSIVSILKKWRSYLKKETGAAPLITDEGNLFDWITSQVEHEKLHPLKIKNPNYFIPINEVSITAEPRSEQDVIVLTNQLIAGGVIRGIKLLATSQYEKYDGIFRYFVSEPLANHVFDKDRNPLGVQELSQSEAMTSRKPYVLEYKHNLDALISDFETEEKNERDIDLAVAWDIGSEWKKRFHVTSLLDLDNIQHRPFHGLTHVFNDDNSGDRRFYAIILSELVAYLNDVDGIQIKQKEKYGTI
jgi:hypothetical protein